MQLTVSERRKARQRWQRLSVGGAQAKNRHYITRALFQSLLRVDQQRLSLAVAGIFIHLGKQRYAPAGLVVNQLHVAGRERALRDGAGAGQGGLVDAAWEVRQKRCRRTKAIAPIQRRRVKRQALFGARQHPGGDVYLQPLCVLRVGAHVKRGRKRCKAVFFVVATQRITALAQGRFLLGRGQLRLQILAIRRGACHHQRHHPPQQLRDALYRRDKAIQLGQKSWRRHAPEHTQAPNQRRKNHSLRLALLINKKYDANIQQ